MNRIHYILPSIFVLTFSLLSFTTIQHMAPIPGQSARVQPHIASRWVMNKAKSSVTFSVEHLVVSTAEGLFKTFDGTMENTKADFSDAKIGFSIDAASIDTDSEGRDNHIKAADYFDVAKYPKITFESTSFKHAGGKKYQLAGNMTLKDVKKAVVFDVLYEGGTTAKGAVATFKCTTVINRYDYNMKAGGAAIGKDVTIHVNVEMNEVK